MITRRGFLGLLGGLAGAEVARKVYVFAPPGGWTFKGGVIGQGEAMFFLPSDGWSYRYAYRNIVTGHVSDATPHIAQLAHTFAFPEMDVVDVYKAMGNNDGSRLHRAGVWGVKG